MDKSLIHDSKLLSYYLRHNPSAVGCTITEDGWVEIKSLCRNSKFTLSYLELIVSEDTRYEISPDLSRIRAFHGHSVPGVIVGEPYVPSCVLYHGTAKGTVPTIQNSGSILPMSRNYVHLSRRLSDALSVGSRHGDACVLTIDAISMFRDGFTFYVTTDNVVLTEKVPIEYII